jgi:DNA polymerase IV
VRKIIHVDMDAFFASVEQRDNPELRGRPVAVGGSSRRGVVAAASYEARKFGVRSAMPSVEAARRCPELVFVKARFDVYKEVSAQIRGIFLSFTPLVEPLSLDEAYLDVTEPLKGPPSGTLIARAIKQEILEATGLTSSAGVAPNKFLAKVASGMNKPDGLTVIRPEQVKAFIDALPIENFYGVGPVTAGRMREAGITCGADLKARSEAELVRRFGKAGHYYHRVAHGQDDRLVRPDRERKSVGAEQTFAEDLAQEAQMVDALAAIAERVAERMDRARCAARTVTVKIKYHDFVQSTRSRTFSHEIAGKEAILDAGLDLLRSPHLPERPVRLLGLSLSTLQSMEGDAPRQLNLDFRKEP